MKIILFKRFVLYKGDSPTLSNHVSNLASHFVLQDCIIHLFVLKLKFFIVCANSATADSQNHTDVFLLVLPQLFCLKFLTLKLAGSITFRVMLSL